MAVFHDRPSVKTHPLRAAEILDVVIAEVSARSR
jgi:hypothetical protein